MPPSVPSPLEDPPLLELSPESSVMLVSSSDANAFLHEVFLTYDYFGSAMSSRMAMAEESSSSDVSPHVAETETRMQSFCRWLFRGEMVFDKKYRPASAA